MLFPDRFWASTMVSCLLALFGLPKWAAISRLPRYVLNLLNLLLEKLKKITQDTKKNHLK